MTGRLQRANILWAGIGLPCDVSDSEQVTLKWSRSLWKGPDLVGVVLTPEAAREVCNHSQEEGNH